MHSLLMPIFCNFYIYYLLCPKLQHLNYKFNAFIQLLPLTYIHDTIIKGVTVV